MQLFQLVEALCQDRDCAIHLGFLGGHRSLTSFVEWTQRNEDVNEEISDVSVDDGRVLRRRDFMVLEQC